MNGVRTWLAVVCFVLGCSWCARAQAVPRTWFCPSVWYGDGECDCACGAFDKDCSSGLKSACSFARNCGGYDKNAMRVLPSMNWRCEGQPLTEPDFISTWVEKMPAEWTGGASRYSDLVCSCGFGTFDFACKSPFSSACEENACPYGRANPNANWACDGWTGPPSYYNTNDGCDCGYGELDPDCKDAFSTSCNFIANACTPNAWGNWACKPLGSAWDLVSSLGYCSSVRAWDPNQQSIEDAIFKLINQYRTSGWVCGTTPMPPTRPVRKSPALRCASRLHTTAVVNGAEPHSNFDERLAGAGYKGPGAGEIINWDFNVDQSPYYSAGGRPAYSQVTALMEGWLVSPTHCGIIMDPSWETVGVGVYSPYYRLGTAAPQAIAVVDFGY